MINKLNRTKNELRKVRLGLCIEYNPFIASCSDKTVFSGAVLRIWEIFFAKPLKGILKIQKASCIFLVAEDSAILDESTISAKTNKE